MSDAPIERTCRKCGATKPLDAFSRSNACRWGRTHTCKACAAQRVGRSDGSPPATRTCRKCEQAKPFGDFKVIRSSHWGRGHICKACAAAHLRGRYAAGIDPNKREAARKWRKDAEMARVADAAVARAHAAGVVVRETVHALVVLERDDGVCGICGEDVDPFDFQVDHIVPLCEGGEHSYENVQVAHQRCNVVKSNTSRKAAAA